MWESHRDFVVVEAIVKKILNSVFLRYYVNYIHSHLLFLLLTNIIFKFCKTSMSGTNELIKAASFLFKLFSTLI